MDNLIQEILLYVFAFVVILVLFTVSVFIGKYLFKAVKKSSLFKTSKFLNPQEYLPEEELSTIKQVFYLIIIVILVIAILYYLFAWKDNSLNLLIFDILVSLYLAITFEATSLKDKFILFMLVPFSSFTELIFASNFIIVFDLLHLFAFMYFIRVYYKKFLNYTKENSLGITIMLLFLIVFISFFVTIVVEGVSPLDSIEMVSNAFTSNGFSILGDSGIGKLNAIFLVWSGFILSSVGTATLTVAIVMKHVNEKFDRLEDMVKKNKKE